MQEQGALGSGYQGALIVALMIKTCIFDHRLRINTSAVQSKTLVRNQTLKYGMKLIENVLIIMIQNN